MDFQSFVSSFALIIALANAITCVIALFASFYHADENHGSAALISFWIFILTFGSAIASGITVELLTK